MVDMMEEELTREYPIYTEDERMLSDNRGGEVTETMKDTFHYPELANNPTLRHGYLASEKFTLADVIGSVVLARVALTEGLDGLPPYCENYLRRMSRRESFKNAPVIQEAAVEQKPEVKERFK
jgi:glutathione S-transferase